MIIGVIFVAGTFSLQIFATFFLSWFDIYPISPPLLPNTLLITWLNCAEMLIYFIVLCLIGIFVYDLQKSSLMHKNLKFICYAISFHISTVGILEIFIITDKFTNGKYLLPVLKSVIIVIHGCSRMHFTLDPASAIIERGLATLKVSHYEKISSGREWIALMFAKEILGIISFYILSSTQIGANIFGIFWISLLIFTVVIGILLYRVNLKSYRTKTGTLTTRYQTVENIRCLKPVLIYSTLAVIQNIITLILLALMFIQYSSNNLHIGYIIGNLINLIVPIFCVFYFLSFLVFSSRIRKHFKKKLKFFRNSRVSPSNTTTIPILSVMGKVLTSSNERKIYFDQLQKSWN